MNAEAAQKQRESLDLGVVGNCKFACMINKTGRVVWGCFPRLDSDPLFCSLLNPKISDNGYFEIQMENFSRSTQRYLNNSAVLVTTLYDKNENALEIIDFVPRFKQFGRVFRPTMLVRQVKPISGFPLISVVLRPLHTYGAGKPEVSQGSNHIRYLMPTQTLRLTTDAPVTFVAEETSFVLEEPTTFIVGPDESLTRPLRDVAREFQEKTDSHWREWVRSLVLPFEWQDVVIRSVITVKMCSYEESGAIVAALTTSIPEDNHVAAGRNWDYRYCWLRDSSSVVQTLNRLGAIQTLEDFLRFITNIVHKSRNGVLQPLYGVALETVLPESKLDSMNGYRNSVPVRVGNRAHEMKRHDVYGSVVLAATQFFFDRRITHPGTVRLFNCLEKVGEQAVSLFDKPDANFYYTEDRWENDIHTFSSIMCWAACDRLSKIAERLNINDRSKFWRDHANNVHAVVCEKAWNNELKCFTSTFHGNRVDAALLLIAHLGFLSAKDPRFVSTLERIETRLVRTHGNVKHLYRDETVLDAHPNSVNICTFWYILALAAVKRKDEARELFERQLECRNHLGLMSEDFDVETGELWGNFPQTLSMVGIIQCALSLSKTWEENI